MQNIHTEKDTNKMKIEKNWYEKCDKIINGNKNDDNDDVDENVNMS